MGQLALLREHRLCETNPNKGLLCSNHLIKSSDAEVRLPEILVLPFSPVQSSASSLSFLSLHALIHLRKVCMCVCAQSCLTLCSPMDYNLPVSSVMEFSNQEYWSVLLFPTPGHLPSTGMELGSLASPTLAGGVFTTGPLGHLLYEGAWKIHNNSVINSS